MSKLKDYLKRGIRYVVKGQPQVHTTANIVSINPSELLKGRKILISGGSKGIGLAMAKKFISEGAEVLITGRSATSLSKVADEIGCKYLVMDITDVCSIEQLYKEAERMMGGVNCLINNAGISLHEACFEEVTIDQYDSQFATNVRGGYFLTQCFVKSCKEYNRKNCKVIFISSQRGVFVDDIPYGLTKATINSLVKGLAHDLIEYDIRVYGLAPGATVTDLIGFDTGGNLFYEINRSKRLYLPEEVAEVANFIVSDASNCLSGNILVCDEGRSINTYKKI